MINLSERLYAAAKLAGSSGAVADVGCDHAYLGMYLLANGLTEHVYALDVHRGPLQRAGENARANGLSGRMDFILSDGLKGLKEPYADTALILGMGGALIGRILEEAPAGAKAAISSYVLGPQSEYMIFRKKLVSLRLTIVDESHVTEDGKYYPLILAKPDESIGEAARKKYELKNNVEYAYGRIGLERGDEVLRTHIVREMEIFSRLLKGYLPQVRRSQLEERYRTAEEALDTYYRDYEIKRDI